MSSAADVSASLSPHDHRAIAQGLDLFHLQEEAPGMVFWHPRGHTLYRLLEERVRRWLRRDGYQEVRTPQVMARSIWEQSGHWQSFREGMLELGEGDFALKPVSCPGHVQIYQRLRPSYRELPLRLSELGLVHRQEPSGALLGLFRLRQFTQDDGHIFCAFDQVAEELARFCDGLRSFYEGFGLSEVAVAFSTRPAERAGSEALWDRAEQAMQAVLESRGAPFRLQPGEGAFYGPKVEFIVEDRLGRAWQCGTIQLDLVMPERFDLRYATSTSGGGWERPAMLHRALFGSVERFIAVLLEHHGAALPAWLAPDQIVLVPVGGGGDYFAEVRRRLEALEVRVRVDAREERLSRKVAEAHRAGAPFLAVIGEREQRERALSWRARGGAQRSAPLEEALAVLATECRAP